MTSKKQVSKSAPRSRVYRSPTLRYTFLFTCSFAALYVLNCLVSMVDYWKAKYPEGSFAFALFAIHVGGVAGYLSPNYLMRWVSPASLLYVSNPMGFVGSALVLVFGELLTTTDPQHTKLFGALAGFVVGFAGSVLQTVSTAYGFRFGSKEIAYLNMGISASGITTVLLQMANIQYLAEDLSTQVMSYELFQLVGVVVIFLITWAYFKDVPRDEFLFKPVLAKAESLSTIDPKEQEISIRLSDSYTTTEAVEVVEDKSPSMWSTFKIIYAYCFSMFFTFTMTMSLTPQIVFGLGMGWQSPQANQVILLAYNVMDTLGRFAFAYWVIESSFINLLLSLLRIAIIAASVLILAPGGYTEFQNNWILTLSITALDGLTKGYLNCSLFHLASEATKGKHSVNSAFLMVLAIMGGLTYGSLINVLAIS